MKRFLLFSLLLIFILIMYVLWDNQRIIVIEQDIYLDKMSAGQEIRILQITDFHEKDFGARQSKLIKRINQLEYDIILFTGDMMNSIDHGDTGPFFDLIQGIENNANAYFVIGNTDPYPYDVTDDSVEKAPYIKVMEKHGVRFLESSDQFKLNGQDVVLTDHELSVLNPDQPFTYVEGKPKMPYENMQSYKLYKQQQLNELAETLRTFEGVLISVTHYPVADPQIDYLEEHPDRYVMRNYDLIIAGHYHGGQIRLPFIGALVVPEAWYPSPLFPPQNRVKGFWEYKGYKQYVSAGLGSSNAVSFLNFRLFNPPEINLITLKSTDSEDE